MKEKLKKVTYIDSYRFGLELECGFDDNSMTQNELRAGLDIIGFKKDEDYHDTGAYIDGVEAVTIGTVKAEYINDHINGFLQFAEDHYYRTAPMQAGLHINISRQGRNFKNRTIINAISLFYSLEDVFYNIVHPDRQYNRFSGKIEEMGRYANKELFNEFSSDLFELEELEDKPFWELRAKLRELKAKHFDFNGKCNGLAIHKLEENAEKRCLEFRLYDAKLENLKFYTELTQKLIKFSEEKTIFEVKNLAKKVLQKPEAQQAKYLLKRLGFTAKQAVEFMN